MKIGKHIIKDTINNLLYRFKAIYRSLSYKGEIRKVDPPEGYSLSFEDDFKTHLNTEVWRYGQPWGDFHPDGLYQYYDTDGKLSYTSKDGLTLELKNTPKKYVKSELPEWRRAPNLPDEFTIPTGIGLVTSKIGWKYGWFESWIKLPKGQTYWPAFWFSGLDTWPPEIDVFEGYTDNGPEYNGKFGLVKSNRIQPNLHYGKLQDGTKEMYGPYNVAIADPTERFVQYVCHW